LSFSCLAPGVDEAAHPGEAHRDLVARLARAKASAVSVQQPNAWVIGSDQIAALDAGVRLGKPGTAARCQEQLRSCSGRSVEFLTAVAVTCGETGGLIEFTDTTRVLFRVLDQATIDRYVAKEQPLDCAGGFKSEGLGISLCESIDSTDPSALIGLPLIRLSAALRTAGFEVP
jgi:septum formation protein